MVKVAVRFTGKVSWEGQANDLPPNVYSFLLFDDYNRNVVVAAIEHQMAQFTKEQGMHVQSVQGDMIDLDQTPQDRKFVPMRWLVEIKPQIINFTQELSLPDNEGVERLSDGSEPVRQ